MAKVTTLTGHTLRVLYLAISPDGETIVTVRPAAPPAPAVRAHTHTHARASETMVMAHPAACPAKDRVRFPHTPPGLACCSQGAGDETLRFWSVFPGAKSKGSSLHNSDMLSPSRAHIR